MAENLAKFNSAMSQFQSGQDGINNYLNSRASSLSSFASSAIADKIGISQEDKEAMDEAIGMVGAAAPVAVQAFLGLKNRAFPKKTAGKGAETSTTEAAKGEASETGDSAAAAETGGKAAETGGEEVGAEEAGTVAKIAPKSILRSGEGGAEEAASAGRSMARTPWEAAEPVEAPGVSFGGELGPTPGGAANAEEAAGQDAGEVAGEGGEAAAAGAEGAEVAATGAAEGASLFSAEAAAAAIPVVGEVALLAGAGYAIYDGIKGLLGGSSGHQSALREAFSGDIAGSGETTAFTSGSYAVASNDGITTQTGGTSAF